MFSYIEENNFEDCFLQNNRHVLHFVRAEFNTKKLGEKNTSKLIKEFTQICNGFDG